MPRLTVRTFFFSLLALLFIALPSAAADETKTDEEKPKETTGYAAYTDSQGHGEKYWRGRMSALTARVRQLDAEVDRLERNAEGLRFQWPADDGTGTKKKAWDNQLNRLGNARKALDEAEEDLRKAEREARRAGALPGWLRPDKEQEAKEAAELQRQPQQGVTSSYNMKKLNDENKKADKDVWGKGKDEEKAAEKMSDEKKTAKDEPGDENDDKEKEAEADE